MTNTRSTPALLGAAVCISLTNVFSTILFNVMTWLSTSSGASLAEAYASLSANAYYMLLAFGSGILANALGGYTAAKQSTYQPYLNATLAALLLMAWFVVMMATPIQTAKSDAWALFTWFVIPVPSAIWGARIFLSRNK